MEIKNITDIEFRKYGRVLKNYDCLEIIERINAFNIPKEVIYEPSVKELEDTKIYNELKNKAFGELPIQIGYCNGNNYSLNAVEYHRSSEINIAVTDLILLLGQQEDINDEYKYETSNIEAFLVPKGTAIEIYATTLHYAPCNANQDGFKCIVVLPKDTNLELENKYQKENEDKLLFAKNKWLIAHKESGLSSEKAYFGLVGENISII